MKKLLLLFGSLSSLLFLSACAEETPAIEEIPKAETNYKSILSYIDNNSLTIVDEVKTSEKGNNEELLSEEEKAELDAEENESKPWDNKNHESVSYIMKDVFLGVNDIYIEEVSFSEKDSKKFIVVEGVVYNLNDKEISYGIFSNSELSVGKVSKMKLRENYKIKLREAGIDFLDFVVGSKENNSFSPESETPVRLLFIVTDKDIDLLSNVVLSNLKLDSVIREEVFIEDRTEEQKAYVKKMNDILNSR